MSAEGSPGAERRRLADADVDGVAWRRWGPYVSERQWGTVREDYSRGGDAWGHLPHDHARSRAYRWGEDGIAGVSDDEQTLCLALALWNGRDPFLKERLFGLTNAQGNHGEDVKEYYFHEDNTPTHSYLRYRYKYPQREFPYEQLVAANAARGRGEFEFELLDTGVFDRNEYFDVTVEYAKATPEDIVMRVTATNRGPLDAPLHLLPTVWFRNTWSWTRDGDPRPRLWTLQGQTGRGEPSVVAAEHPRLGRRLLLCEGTVPLLFTENETNAVRLFGAPDLGAFVKDGIDRAVVHGERSAVHPNGVGTKAAAHYAMLVPAGGSVSVRLRLTDANLSEAPGPAPDSPSFADCIAMADAVVDQRRAEADQFYDELLPAKVPDDERQVVRAALSGMLWSKQYYAYDVDTWVREHGERPGLDRAGRNRTWVHLRAGDVVSVPDTWEYPWFAAWDLAFHCIPLSMVDPQFAMQQIDLLLDRRYLAPNGQMPAYEWNFSDVNPPVHAWAAYFVYELVKRRTGVSDVAWLENVFHKLTKNFAWWVNQKDAGGRNVFEGGFLGLDNIGVFDRSATLPTGGSLDQADATAWMALYCQTMLQIALELAQYDSVYVEQAATFLEHFGWIALAVHGQASGASMWDEDDGFFYDSLRLPDGSATRLAVRSAVGLLPLAATTVLPRPLVERHPELVEAGRGFVERHPEVSWLLATNRSPGTGHLLAMFDEVRLRRVLGHMFDEQEFLGPFGIRSLSKVHERRPYEFRAGGRLYRVAYTPAESDSAMFGGNSNWRGPVWFPINALLVRALLNLYAFYGDGFRIDFPTGSGRSLTLYQVARELSRRLTRTFTRGPDGRRPVYGGQEVFQTDPHWRDLLTFPEYFHGDNGAGLGAGHQTGWTGLVAVFPHLFAVLRPEDLHDPEPSAGDLAAGSAVWS